MSSLICFGVATASIITTTQKKKEGKNQWITPMMIRWWLFDCRLGFFFFPLFRDWSIIITRELPWEPPSIWRAFTNRRCKSGDQHLLAFLWVWVLAAGAAPAVWASDAVTAAFTCSIATPPFTTFSLRKAIPFSVSEHFLSSTSLWSVELARARSGRARRFGLGHEFRSFEKGRKAPPFLCLLSKPSFGLIVKPISASLEDAIKDCCLVSLPAGLHSWADVIQLALSEKFDAFSGPSGVECLRGMNSSRNGLGPWFAL